MSKGKRKIATVDVVCIRVKEILYEYRDLPLVDALEALERAKLEIIDESLR